MTRINVGISPQELPDKLLLAEHREITRIPNALLSRRADLSKPIPKEFTLGRGHVRFYDKIRFLHVRYELIYKECRQRGFHVGYRGVTFQMVEVNIPACYGEYKVRPQDRVLLEERIRSKGFSLIPVFQRPRFTSPTA